MGEQSNRIQTRDPYIDFLRAFGMLMLVIAHTAPPTWLKVIRTFDVPLMVFLSAVCYKPLRGGYLRYVVKRFKRIYYPVASFLIMFFSVETISFILFGKPHVDPITVLGSFLLLNVPSIGYVWIMRVFLIMALLMPALHQLTKKMNIIVLIFIIFSLMIIQELVVDKIGKIDNKILKFVLDETFPYAIGYSIIAMIGLKIKEFSSRDILLFLMLLLVAIGSFVWFNEGIFDPQAFKYPPQSLYLLYGLFGSLLLWSLKPFISKVTDYYFFHYLSKESMWIYLWHIIPVALWRWDDAPNLWFLRYCVVLSIALILTKAYRGAVLKLSYKN